MIKARTAKFQIGQIVRHRLFSFRGVIFDIDPEFNNTEEWWLSIPENVRPSKDQPFYHLFAENSESEYVAYVSEQNLLPDTTGEPVRHPQVKQGVRARRQRQLPAAQFLDELNFPSAIGIGGSLAAPPLPHHRTYGSVYGGSRSYANALRSNDSTRVGWAFGLIHRRE